MMTAIEALKKYQKQLDAEGVEVGVSRQALDEVLHDYEQLQQQLSEANEKLDKARECLYQISTPLDANVKSLANAARQTLKDIE